MTDERRNVAAELRNVISVSAGHSHRLAALSDGRVIAWGNNASGQCDVPYDLKNVKAAAAGSDYSLALKADGTVVSWGGLQSPDWPSGGRVPAELNGVRSISAGGGTSIARLHDGSAVFWGNGTLQGSGGRERVRRAGVVGVSAGDMHICAVSQDGELWHRSFEVAQTYEPVNHPSNLPPLAEIAVGSGFCVGLTQDHKVVAWGRNDYGQASPPYWLQDVIAVSAGGGTGLALRADGSVIQWGSSSAIPSSVEGVLQISAGPISIALLHDGTVVEWGQD